MKDPGATVAPGAHQGPASGGNGALAIFARNRFSLLGLAIIATLALVALIATQVSPFDANTVGVGPTLAPPDARHWMGTDDLGRDVFSRVLGGMGVSLLVGFSTAAMATTVGVPVGALAGFAGGRLDDLLMRATEMFLVFPRFFLAILLVAFFHVAPSPAAESPCPPALDHKFAQVLSEFRGAKKSFRALLLMYQDSKCNHRLEKQRCCL